MKAYVYARRSKAGGYYPEVVSSPLEPEAFAYSHKMAIRTNPQEAARNGLNGMEIRLVGEFDLDKGELKGVENVLVADCSTFFPEVIKSNGN